MKTALAIIGYICLSMIILGSLFKIQQWPGAGPLVIFGIALFNIPFLILFFIYRIKKRFSDIDLPESVALTLSLSLLSLGLLFKVQHWPGAGPFLIVGISCAVFFFLPLRLIRFFKSKEAPTSLNLLGGLMAIAGTLLALSMQVNYEVLNGYIQSDALLVENNKSIALLNEEFGNKGSDSSSEFDKVREIRNRTQAILTLIESYKIWLISTCEGYPEDQHIQATDLSQVYNLGNYDIPTYILIGSSPMDPKTDEFSANYLKNELHRYRDELINSCESQEARSEIFKLLDLKDQESRGYLEPWEIKTFYHIPLASVINTLSTLQNSVLAAEGVALRVAN